MPIGAGESGLHIVVNMRFFCGVIFDRRDHIICNLHENEKVFLAKSTNSISLTSRITVRRSAAFLNAIKLGPMVAVPDLVCNKISETEVEIDIDFICTSTMRTLKGCSKRVVDSHYDSILLET